MVNDDIIKDDFYYRLFLNYYFLRNRVFYFGEDPNYHNRVCGLQVGWNIQYEGHFIHYFCEKDEE